MFARLSGRLFRVRRSPGSRELYAIWGVPCARLPGYLWSVARQELQWGVGSRARAAETPKLPRRLQTPHRHRLELSLFSPQETLQLTCPLSFSLVLILKRCHLPLYTLEPGVFSVLSSTFPMSGAHLPPASGLSPSPLLPAAIHPRPKLFLLNPQTPGTVSTAPHPLPAHHSAPRGQQVSRSWLASPRVTSGGVSASILTFANVNTRSCTLGACFLFTKIVKGGIKEKVTQTTHTLGQRPPPGFAVVL